MFNNDFGLGEDADSDSADNCSNIYEYLRCLINSQGDLVTDSCRKVHSDTGSCEEDEKDDRMAVNSSTPSLPLAILPSSEISTPGTAGSSTESQSLVEPKITEGYLSGTTNVAPMNCKVI